MEFGYRAVFIAVPPTAPSVRSYVNRDTNAWKRKGLTDEKAEKGRGEFRAFETTSTTSVTLKIGKRGRREKKDDEKRERERESCNVSIDRILTKRPPLITLQLSLFTRNVVL